MRIQLLIFVSFIIYCSCFSSPSKSHSRLSREEKVKKLREILKNEECTVMPCVYDGLSAKMVENAGFDLTFMTGFGVAAARGLPDLGLLSMGEIVEQAQIICENLGSIPTIGDADTGYGNPINVKRTVSKFVQAGLSGIMIEDQVSPKRCGHTKGKLTVDRDEAYRRIKAAVDARTELGEDIVILARTDARGTVSLDEAIERCKMFRELGADWTFLEAPENEEEMKRYCDEVDGPKMCNMLEFGKTPILEPHKLKKLGFSVAAYPLTLLSASSLAMKTALDRLKRSTASDAAAGEQIKTTDDTSLMLSFKELQQTVGFNDYYEDLDKYL